MPHSQTLSLKECKLLFESFKFQMENKSPRRRCPVIRNINHQVINTHTHPETKPVVMRNHPHLLLLNEDARTLECQRQLLQAINFFPEKGTYSNLHSCICMSSFQLKTNFASCDKALTKTVTSVLSKEEVGFPFFPQEGWRALRRSGTFCCWLCGRESHILTIISDKISCDWLPLALGLAVTWLTTFALYDSGKNNKWRAEEPE